MAIMLAMEKGNYVCVYNERDSEIFSKHIDPSIGDRLVGFTSSTVSIKIGNWICVYDERGSEISSKYCG